MLPETRYAVLDGLRLAYQVTGEGPPDLVMSAGSFSHTDALWEDPAAELFLRRVAGFARLIRFDLAGSSGSDRVPPGVARPSFSAQLETVLAATGSERVAILGMLDAGPGVLQYVADHPQRVSALVLYNSTARWTAAEGYAIGVDEATARGLRAMLEGAWGTHALVEVNVPSHAHDTRFRAWYAKYVRSLGTPTDVLTALDHMLTMDATPALDRIRVPTLVLHRRDYGPIPLAHGAYLAEHIEGAELVVLPGADGPPHWETPETILDHLERFITGQAPRERSERRLLTILFTDIVQSTEQAGQLGDRDWSTVLGLHYEISERTAARLGGTVVNRTGDGVLCAFTSPSDALRAAARMRDDLRAMAITIRCGLHAGEVESQHGELSGLALHVAARIMAEAGPGEVLASRTVRDLVAGSPARFADVGERQLKGIEERWRLYRVDEA
jgi:class 3 adenylate cyclase/pimeloyl-ACP methyl ester carboxylesterase